VVSQLVTASDCVHVSGDTREFRQKFHKETLIPHLAQLFCRISIALN
jgi:hypothetical protein